MGFIDAYKHLEKLCGEILNDDRRVSAYIDEMIGTPRGSFYVRTWDDDLKNLKHYRWVRNQISHEPGCNEANMCKPEDELWLNNFYYRILNQTDPLAMYRKACSAAAIRNRVQVKTQDAPTYNPPAYGNTHQTPRQRRSYTWILIVAIIVLAVIVLLSTKFKSEQRSCFACKEQSLRQIATSAESVSSSGFQWEIKTPAKILKWNPPVRVPKMC